MNKSKFIIVGGVAGGASAAARLRRLDEHAEIILLERGEFISFANCGLPYYIGGEITERDALTIQTPDSFYERFCVDVRVFHEMIAIDREKKTATVRNNQTGETYIETYDKMILSMGAEPIRPPIVGVESKKVFTVRNIPDTDRVKNYITEQNPKTVAIMGGGYIGVEMAENLHRAGLSVTVLEMSDQVIAPLDFDMAAEVHQHMRSQGVNLMLGHAVKKIQDNGSDLTITLNEGTVQADFMIMAIGVKPETGIAKEAGLAVGIKGHIITNDEMLTSDPNIYAVGDAVEVIDFITGQSTAIPLAGPANKQGRIAADNVCGGHSKYTGTQGSAILKIFDMTIATTGINEKTAKRLHFNYDKLFTYSPSHASYYPNAVNLAIKTIFDKETGKILGAQVVGFDGVDKRCDVLATAIRFGATAYDLERLELCYAPPYSSAKDPVNIVGFAIENVLTGKVKSFHWHEVADLQKDDQVILLDIRTALEYEGGSIDGFINIPLEELRTRLGELDAKKKIYVTCQMGQRGYIAARILSQNGFDVYSLSGGYRQ
ncbi:MAG: FAD-dependent oxidoreductase, partial [Evtepia sp.]